MDTHVANEDSVVACLHRNQALETLFAFFLACGLVCLCGCVEAVVALVICELNKLLWGKVCIVDAHTVCEYFSLLECRQFFFIMSD